jgi:hypothetical protein
MRMPPVHHYYHIYADGAWEEPVREHTDALRLSGLEDYPEFRFRIGLVGKTENVQRVKDYLHSKGVAWDLLGSSEEGWEQLTLAALARDCQHHEGFAFYAHTKGAHTPSRFNTAWRKRMTYFNVIMWKEAVASLNHASAYGCHWMELDGSWIFGGNFWWTHMEHLRLLGPVSMENRWKAEEWVGHLRQRVKDFKASDPAGPFPGKVAGTSVQR